MYFAIDCVRVRIWRLFWCSGRSPEPKTADAEERFTHVLDKMMSEHNNVQATIARGLQELHSAGDKRIRSVTGNIFNILRLSALFPEQVLCTPVYCGMQ